MAAAAAAAAAASNAAHPLPSIRYRQRKYHAFLINLSPPTCHSSMSEPPCPAPTSEPSRAAQSAAPIAPTSSTGTASPAVSDSRGAQQHSAFDAFDTQHDSASHKGSTPQASRWSRDRVLAKGDRWAASFSSSLRSIFSSPAPAPSSTDSPTSSGNDRNSSSPLEPSESFSCCGVNVEFPLPAVCSLPYHGALLFLHDDAVDAFKAFGPTLQHVIIICPHSRPLYAPSRTSAIQTNFVF
jgi:hypothetical protein